MLYPFPLLLDGGADRACGSPPLSDHGESGIAVRGTIEGSIMRVDNMSSANTYRWLFFISQLTPFKFLKSLLPLGQQAGTFGLWTHLGIGVISIPVGSREVLS